MCSHSRHHKRVSRGRFDLELNLRKDPKITREKYILKKELATRFRVSTSTIERWASNNIIPSPIRLGPNRIVWDINEIIEWEISKKEESDNVK